MIWRQMPGARVKAWAVIVIALVGIAIAIGTVWSPASGTIEFELLKFIIQFLLIVALGAVAAIVVEAEKRRMDAAASDHQYAVDELTSALERLDTVYRRLKQVRFSYAIHPLPTTYEDYEKKMSRLRAKKQDLEELWRDLQARTPFLPVGVEDVRCRVEAMEKYFDPLEKEWKAVADSVQSQDYDQEALHQFKLFRTRSNSGEKSDSRSRLEKSGFPAFRDQYYATRKALIDLISTLRTGRTATVEAPDDEQHDARRSRPSSAGDEDPPSESRAMEM